jgi:hypothetical protein
MLTAAGLRNRADNLTILGTTFEVEMAEGDWAVCAMAVFWSKAFSG